MKERKRAKLRSPRLGCGVVIAIDGSSTDVLVARAKFMVGVNAGIAVESGKISTSDLVVDAGLLAAMRGMINSKGFRIMGYWIMDACGQGKYRGAPQALSALFTSHSRASQSWLPVTIFVPPVDLEENKVGEYVSCKLCNFWVCNTGRCASVLCELLASEEQSVTSRAVKSGWLHGGESHAAESSSHICTATLRHLPSNI